MHLIRKSLLALLLGAGLTGLTSIASAEQFNLELVVVSGGNENGASTNIPPATDGTWVYDDVAGTVTLSGTQRVDYDIAPVPPAGDLFSHIMTNAVFDLDSVTISGTAFECIEGVFGGGVGAFLCANVNFGPNFLKETTLDYATVPGTRIVGGDDVPAGPQQQLSDYASALVSFNGSTLIIETPSWTANPGGAGLQLEFLVTDVVPMIDVPDVTGLEQTDAENAILAARLTVGKIDSTPDPSVAAGHIISQNSLPCSACAMLNDPVQLVVSQGPTPVETIPDQIHDLKDEVRELDLPHWLNNGLLRQLSKASGTLRYCAGNANKMNAFSAKSKRQKRYERWYRHTCKNGGADKAVGHLRVFALLVKIFSGRKIPVPDAEALIAEAQSIIDDILTVPPVTGIYTVISNGVEREYYLSVPDDYDEYDDPLPIIFGFHGATGTYMDWFEGGFHGDGLQNIARDKAILVFPQALESTGGITLWNGEVDFEFFEDLLADLQSKLNIDSNRIFATGHSAGGGFSHQLGCLYGDVLRAIAPSSGFLLDRECTGAVAVLQMQSTEDQVANIVSVELTRDVWVAYNGYDLDINSEGVTEPCIDYSLGNSIYPVQWCPHVSFGANGHQWWDDADEAIWKFFSNLPTAVPSPDPPPGGGNERILEDFPASLTFTVRYRADMNPVELLTAVLYPAGTEQPIVNAPLWFLNGDIPFAPATPGTVQEYQDVPVVLPVNTDLTPVPGTYTLSIGVFVEGGSFPIPAPGIDQIALIEIEVGDQTSPIVVEEILELVPVEQAF